MGRDGLLCLTTVGIKAFGDFFHSMELHKPVSSKVQLKQGCNALNVQHTAGWSCEGTGTLEESLLTSYPRAIPAPAGFPGVSTESSEKEAQDLAELQVQILFLLQEG